MKTKKLILTACLSLVVTSTDALAVHNVSEKAVPKEITLGSPVILDVLTNYKTIKEALIATKMALMQQKFIATNGIQETSFTAKRTSGSHADYYIADVMASKMEDGTINVTITFMKIGSGMLRLSKISDKVKQKLNIKSDISASNSVQSNNSLSSLDKNSYLSIDVGFLPFYKKEQDAKTTPIFSLKYEVGLSSRFGLRFNFGYGHNEGSYIRTRPSYFGVSTQFIQWDYNHINFGSSLVFYPIKKEKIDVYALTGVGLDYRLERAGIGFDTKLNLKAGLRYHLTDRIGAYAEAGLGLSKFNLGLSLKL